MIRTIIQFLLCVGVLPLYWYLLILMYAILKPSSLGELSSFSFWNWVFFMIFVAATIGVPALFISIFVTPAKILKRHWLRNVVIAGLIGGSITAVTFLVAGVPGDLAKKNWPSLWAVAWMIGGPLMVALWNLWRLWKEPSQPPQPTQICGADPGD